MLVVGCTKTRFTLLYKRKIDLPVRCLTAKFPPKTAGNCLTKKLFNYLFFFWVWFEKILFFSRKSSENGPKNGSNFTKIISRKNYLIICFLVVSRSNFWRNGIDIWPIFLLRNTPTTCPERPKKVNHFRRNRRGKKQQKWFTFFVRCWLLAAPKRVLHYYTSLELTSPFSVWRQNFLQTLPEIVSRKNYLIICFFGFGSKKYFFFPENRPKMVPKMAQTSQKLSHEKII